LWTASRTRKAGQGRFNEDRKPNVSSQYRKVCVNLAAAEWRVTRRRTVLAPGGIPEIFLPEYSHYGGTGAKCAPRRGTRAALPRSDSRWSRRSGQRLSLLHAGKGGWASFKAKKPGETNGCRDLVVCQEESAGGAARGWAGLRPCHRLHLANGGKDSGRGKNRLRAASSKTCTTGEAKEKVAFRRFSLGRQKNWRISIFAFTRPQFFPD